MINPARILLFLLILTTFTAAQFPHQMSYQGKVTTLLGVGINDTVDIIFRIYNDELWGTLRWQETQADIPVIQVDRGGQVTYHAPGQWVIYLLVDLRRRGLGVRDLVDLIEQSIVEFLAGYGIEAAPDPKAPGVYVSGDKIASLGLRVRRGCSYHGLSLNVDMDLEPFQRINPCGHAGLQVTSMARLLPDRALEVDSIGRQLLQIVARRLEGS